MRRILFALLFALVVICVIAESLEGVVVDKGGKPLPYSTIRVKNRRIGTLADSVGHFNLKLSAKIKDKDTVVVSYIGYETKEFPFAEIKKRDEVCIDLAPANDMLQEVTVYPRKKLKKRKQGKKHGGALLKTFMDGEMAGECFGYEFHAKKNKKLILDKVGFYYCYGDSQMTKMKFRINVYDMSGVKKAPSSKFINILSKPIYFDYELKDAKSGKFEFELPDPVALPKDAMVEIEFLENLGNEKFWFKCNLIGKRTWAKSLIEGFWDTNPFATPFFVECVEMDDRS